MGFYSPWRKMAAILFFCYFLHNRSLTRVDALILSLKTSIAPEQPQELWKELSHSLSQAHIDTILLACTDLSPLAQAADSTFKVVDSSRCLAEAVVRHYLLYKAP